VLSASSAHRFELGSSRGRASDLTLSVACTAQQRHEDTRDRGEEGQMERNSRTLCFKCVQLCFRCWTGSLLSPSYPLAQQQ
jgi:hypothetical protein